MPKKKASKKAGRPKTDTVSFNCKVQRDTRVRLNQLAIALELTHGDGGAIGKLMDAIAQVPPETMAIIIRGCNINV